MVTLYFKILVLLLKVNWCFYKIKSLYKLNIHWMKNGKAMYGLTSHTASDGLADDESYRKKCSVAVNNNYILLEMGQYSDASMYCNT